MGRKALVIGAQGVIGSFVARALRDAGWEVTRGGRRPEEADDFRLVDLDREETVKPACADADLVVTPVPHPEMTAERVVLRDGGVLLHLLELPPHEVDRLTDEISQPRGLVVDHSGLGGVTGLAVAELLEQHPDADAVEFGFIASAAEKTGSDGAMFIRRLTRGGGRHATATIELPKPFGRRRCIEASRELTEHIVGPLAGDRAARLYLCFAPRAFGAAVAALNALGLLSRLPASAFTVGRGKVPDELSSQPTAHWARVLRGDEALASRFVLGNGDYRSTVGATIVFADALVPSDGERPARAGAFVLQRLFRLGDLEPALAERGITVQRA